MNEKKNPSVESQIAAAEAERLLQRAKRLPDAADVVERLKAVQEAARRLRTVEEAQAKGKGLANALNALEGEIRAREAKVRQEQKESRETIDAVGALANDLTSGFSR